MRDADNARPSDPEYQPDADGSIAIYLPSRYKDGQAIPQDLRVAVWERISGCFSRRFGGTSKPERVLGSFDQKEGQLRGFVVDEAVEVYRTLASRETAKQWFKEVKGLAAEMAGSLAQESVGLEWFGDFFFVASDRDSQPMIMPFGSLPSQHQQTMAALALLRVRTVRDLILFLSLDDWKKPEPGNDIDGDGMEVLAIKGQNRVLRLGAAHGRDHLRRAAEKARLGDVLFEDFGPHALVHRKDAEGRLTDGKRFSFPAADGKINRQTFMLALALLGSPSVLDLSTLLERRDLTSHFFASYTAVTKRATEEFASAGISMIDAEQEARLLVGRLMVLKFLESKGILGDDRDYLRRRFESRTGSYYRSELVEGLFESLDRPRSARDASVLPYLNGGLFRRTAGWMADLPDRFFDPEAEDSILGIFSRYDFALSTGASFDSETLAAVEPSVFGHVLESICSAEDRKKKGVHYTPDFIARALARESLLARLADLSGLDEKRLRSFRQDSIEGLSPDEAKQIMDLLPQLRILDPAAGSGALLLAMLEELMALLERSSERWGESLKQGGPSWGRHCRRFVRECLFGVDIDEAAIEIARLRFWLFIALADLQPEALPDLSYNLHAGDSLSPVLPPENLDERVLEFKESAARHNDFIAVLKKYRSAPAAESRQVGEGLADAERAYSAAWIKDSGHDEGGRLAAGILAGGPVPFAWHIHFPEVFAAGNRGFDIVIANPPYIRAQALALDPSGAVEDYVRRFPSFQKGAKDLYLAFVEQALGLAGKQGRIAFIMPTFARSKAGGRLREILAERGAVESWVDFGDQQVFDSASNYVALLFATAERRRRKRFDVRCPILADAMESGDFDWLAKAPKGSCPYNEASTREGSGPSPAAGIWRPLSASERRLVEELEASGHSVGDACESIGVGVQTSADDVYLLQAAGPGAKGCLRLESDFSKGEVEIEEAALRPCAKGSAHLKPNHFEEGCWILWPYDAEGDLIPEKAFKATFPKAWRYLSSARERLATRYMDQRKPTPGDWIRFGRNQGILTASRPKILVPSLMRPATAWYDTQGRVAFTASGKGGGGAWALLPKGGEKGALELTRWLNSEAAWEWLKLEGDPKLDGWRGVDKATLGRMPFPAQSKPEKAT